MAEGGTRDPRNRWQNMLREGDPRALARQCTARSKQSGERCRNAARKGKTVCGFHGVRRSDKPTPETIERRIRSAQINAQRDALGQLLETGGLHPEAREVYARQYAGRIRERDVPGFLLMLDKRLRGQIGTHVWLDVVHRYCSQAR